MVALDVNNIQIAESVDLPFASYILLADNIVWVRYKTYDKEIGLEEAIQSTDAVSRLTRDLPVSIIIDVRGCYINFSNEAREYFARDANYTEKRKSQALVIDGLAHKLVANFYMRFNRPTCPVAVFENPQEALEWTRKIRTPEKE